MAFHVRKDSLNHSPIWYRDHCLAEDGGSPAFRAMLKADVKLLDCMDKTLSYEELVEDYAEEWDGILSGNDAGADPSELKEVLEREGELGYRPVELYSKPPFTTITRLMQKAGLSTTDLGVFLRWKAKADNVKKARAAKAKKRKRTKKVDTRERFKSFLRSKRKGQSVVEL